MAIHNSIKKPELLIPAGNMEKLETAIRFGADAVYVGAGDFSLRTMGSSFDLQALQQAITHAHTHNVKLFLAMNIFPFDEDLPTMMTYLKEALTMGVDALIVSDVGLISLIQKLDSKIPIHLSTQANTLNSAAVQFWQHNGLKRIVLGREVNLEQIKNIKTSVPKIELEAFAHGAMCMSYSGRCLLSKHMTGRSANRGDCTQPCRWEYHMRESKRPDEDFLIQEDKRGTYILNSKDLCMIEHIPELVQSGIDSLKVEGRMKSVYYVAVVTKIYREAIDTYCRDPKNYTYQATWKEELYKIPHRHYSTGFYFGEDGEETIEEGRNIRNYEFVGIVARHHQKKNVLEIKARNYFGIHDELEIIDPQISQISTFKITTMKNEKDHLVEKAHNEHHIFVDVHLGYQVSADSLLRRRRLKSASKDSLVS
jgi:U32 family peptidase